MRQAVHRNFSNARLQTNFCAITREGGTPENPQPNYRQNKHERKE